MSRRCPPDRLLLALAYLGFVSLGLPDAALGIVWPSVRSAFALPQAALGWPLAAAATGYFLSGLLAGHLMRAAGAGGLLASSTALAALGVAGYALSPSAPVFVAAAMIVGWGSGAVDTGLNSYAAQRFAPRHMAWLHAAYSAGAALGSATLLPFVGQRWRYGYGVIATALALLGVAFFLSQRRWSVSEPKESEPPLSQPKTALSALHLRPVRLQALLFFVYSGVEVGVGSWGYTILTQARGLTPRIAASVVTVYWTSLFVGRVLSGFIVKHIANVVLLRAGTAVASVGALLFAIPILPVPISAFGLSLVGLAIAPIYPGLMSDTPRRVGERVAPHAVGLQVSAATAGAVLLPTAGGLIGAYFGLAFSAAFIASCALVLFALHELLVSVTEGGQRVGRSAPSVD